MTDIVLDQQEQKIYEKLEKIFEKPTYIFEKTTNQPAEENTPRYFFHIKRVGAKNYSFFYTLYNIRENDYECNVFLCKENSMAFHGTGFFKKTDNGNLILQSHSSDFCILSKFYEKVLKNIEEKRPLPPPTNNNLDSMLSFIKED